MAQWSPFISAVPEKPPLPPGIPEAWQKAQQALQAVNPAKTSASECPTSQIQTAAMTSYPAMAWSQQPMFYPGFTGYPNYGYYNMNLQDYNYPCFMMPSTAQTSLPSTISAKPDIPTKILNSESPLSLLPNILHSLAASAGRPDLNKNNFNNNNKSPGFGSINSQAPGSSNIKFNLPKKYNTNNNFQAVRDPIHEGIKNLMKTQDKPVKNENSRKPLTSDADAPKSLNAMSVDSWPAAVQKYVNDSFAKCKDDVDRNQVQTILRGKLMRANGEGTIFTKDWSKEPLPSILSDRVGPQQHNKPDLPNVMHNQLKTSPFQPKSVFHNKRISSYRPRSRSRSHSRSRSRSPPRKVVRKKRHSSSSSTDSSSGSRNSKRAISSRIVGSTDSRSQKSSNLKNKQSKSKQFKKGVKKHFTVESDLCTDERLLKRAARFENKVNKSHSSFPKNNSFNASSNSFVIDETGEDIEWSNDAIVGTSQDIEKPFLRLTGAVDPSGVRPEEVLVKSLAMVKKRWIQKQDYHFACEQLKSIRQDLVVQCVRNEFTVEVYETHARIALEKGDHTEFNQCQSQLKTLYQEVKKGNKLEFTGYHILYTMYTENAIELKNLLADLNSDDKSDEVVSHALKISKAYSNSNYCRFFKLYLSAPKMSNFIIDWFIEKIRKAALKAIIKSFRPNLPVSYVECALAFPSSDDCLAFLTKANIVFSNDGVINCKDSVGPLANF